MAKSIEPRPSPAPPFAGVEREDLGCPANIPVKNTGQSGDRARLPMPMVENWRMFEEVFGRATFNEEVNIASKSDGGLHNGMRRPPEKSEVVHFIYP
jgi:hypothetical protein